MDSLPPAADWLAEQRRRNAQARGEWDSFAGHRQQVMALLIAAAVGRTDASLCLLGAGNCNDVDLPALLDTFGQVHVVDCDGESLAAAVQRQGVADRPNLLLHSGVDLSATAPPHLPPADVVASHCLLSQLIESATATQQPASPPALELIQAIRRRHLQQMVELLKPGGSGLLVTDLVSSDTAPQLQTISREALAPFVAQCIASRNFFSGLNPAVLIDLLAHDLGFARQVSDVEPIHPWKWQLGPRSFAVYAIRFRRRS